VMLYFNVGLKPHGAVKEEANSSCARSLVRRKDVARRLTHRFRSRLARVVCGAAARDRLVQAATDANIVATNRRVRLSGRPCRYLSCDGMADRRAGTREEPP
jgi:hypothetical protein